VSGIYNSRYSRYVYTLSPFAFAVSTILYTAALASAPFGVSANNQFFLPTQNGRILFSASYLYMRISSFMYRIFLSSSFSRNHINLGKIEKKMWITISFVHDNRITILRR
jgi:hypothetical protein